ncbi:MAG TPA: FkbM family methyltransferase [Acidimicrobiales bacterium]|nr:FkbM family methyltransferase [Acidimicrobiales bacterium]
MTLTVSYAQNCEDIVLERLFKARGPGRYIDVGAGDPDFESVTKLFYERGWRGINVEPNPTLFSRLAAARPEDINLQLALSDKPGRANLHSYDNPAAWGYATISEETVSRDGNFSRVNEVEVSTLGILCEKYGGGMPFDFLKIDVEGHEKNVILGVDWSLLRPRTIVVEAVRPGSHTPNHDEWEHLLLAAGYRFVLFDGLNRFYVGDEDEEAASLLSSPASVLDSYIAVNHVRALLALQQLKASLAAAQSESAELARDAEQLTRRTEQLQSALAALTTAL